MIPRPLSPLLCGLSGEVHSGNPAQAPADAAVPFPWFEDALATAYTSEEDQGIRTNSRWLRATNHGGGGNPDLVNSGRGDEPHTVYAGLNDLVRGHHLKFQASAGYAALKTPGSGDGDVGTLT